MNEARMKVLEMLENKTITVAEANELLSSLENGDKKNEDVVNNGLEINKNNPKVLRIFVDAAGEAKVNITLPIAFIKAAIKAGTANAVFDKTLVNVNENIKESIDLDSIINCIESNYLGEIVNIDSEDAKVIIKIE